MDGVRKHKQPSDKQIKAIALKAQNPSMTAKEAAIQAGYSPTTAHNAKQNIFGRPIVKTWLDNYRYTIEKAGLTQDRVARKLDELMDSSYTLRDKKTGQVIAELPNHKLQLETIKVYNEIFGVKVDHKDNDTQGLKRRVTLEEFEEKEELIPLEGK